MSGTVRTAGWRGLARTRRWNSDCQGHQLRRRSEPWQAL